MKLLAAILTVAAGATVLAISVGAGGSERSKSAAPTYYQDVKPILDGRCTGCHFRGGIAPFSLTSYEQAYRARHAIAAAVSLRRMPPWHAAAGGPRYRHDPSLTQAQIDLVARWAATGRAGNPTKPAPALPSVAPRLSRVDLRLPMPAAYTPERRDGADDYRCFVLPWSPKKTTHVTGVDVNPGRPREVHHMILYLAGPASGATLKRWDAAEPRAGYGCYGGPSATGAAEGLGSPQFIAGWVPGAAGGDFPAGTGIEIPRGAHLILQVHYNLDYVDPKPDRSVVELSTAAHVERRAVFMPLVNPIWVISPGTFVIPKGRARVVHRFGADVAAITSFLGRGLGSQGGLEIDGVLLHMHRLGHSGEIAVERAGGGRESLLSIPRWSFHWQRQYDLAKPVDVSPGDRLTITCVHDNSAGKQPLLRGGHAPPRRVIWGEDSSDEMCIGFLYVTGR
jgi:hypothetical protein